MRLLVDAVAFCYGPATVLHHVLRHWRSAFEHVTLAGTGTTIEHLSRAGLVDEYFSIDTEDPYAIECGLKGKWDVLVCVQNPTGFPALRRFARRSVYWDFLLWMRADGPGEEFSADRYVIEGYPGTRRALGRWRRWISYPMLSPVLATWVQTPPRDRQGPVIVNLGGQRSRLTYPGVNTHYPERMVEALVLAFDLIPSPPAIRICADTLTINDLSRRWQHPSCTFASIGHSEFLDALADAPLLITHPGLYSPFEAIGFGTPTVFLPSSNYTQILQLAAFRKRGLAPWAVDWTDLIGQTVQAGLAESDGVREVLQLVTSLEQVEVIKRLGESLGSWLSLNQEELDICATEQRNSAAKYYGDVGEFMRGLLSGLCGEGE
jgi:hypothetical protein